MEHVAGHEGVALHVVRRGEAGEPVVFLHGLLLGNVATWFFGAQMRLAAHHRTLSYDLRGHGRSDVPATGYDLGTMAADLDAVLQATDTVGAHLVGHSYGGLVALRWALDGGRPASITLVDSPLPPGGPDEIGAFLHQTPEAMVDALPEGLKAAVAGGRRQARKLLEHLHRLATETTVLADLDAAEGFDEGALRALDVPVHLVYGTRSGCADDARTLADWLPDARLTWLDGGHYLHLDQPAALVEAIAEGLRG